MFFLYYSKKTIFVLVVETTKNPNVLFWGLNDWQPIQSRLVF